MLSSSALLLSCRKLWQVASPCKNMRHASTGRRIDIRKTPANSAHCASTTPANVKRVPKRSSAAAYSAMAVESFSLSRKIDRSEKGRMSAPFAQTRRTSTQAVFLSSTGFFKCISSKKASSHGEDWAMLRLSSTKNVEELPFPPLRLLFENGELVLAPAPHCWKTGQFKALSRFPGRQSLNYNRGSGV